ncbi:MAG: manganese efflux pump [Clostridia bacterium]|nr:manganese efflux pump [Clostridia bacterium]MBP3650928.1 manganese efflux pump [Clostridia bacterium]
MGIWELIVVAIGVSMDAFAIAICKGLSVQRLEKKHMITAGLWFGGAQALMPLIGYLLGSTFADAITSIDHWLTFILLALIGANMIRESRSEADKLDADFSAKAMFPLAIADSIDALAVGVTFAFMNVSIIPAVLLIGVATFLFSAAGVKIGHQFGARFKSKAEMAGGIILIVIGLSVLLEHLGVL